MDKQRQQKPAAIRDGHTSSEVALPPAPKVEAGERFGPYRLIRELGAGGMGRVFLAERDDDVFEKEVALKFVRHDVGSEVALGRFLAERRMLARLEHPHIATLLDGGVSDGGVPFLVMEYVRGHSIGKYCDDHRLTVRKRVELFLDVCEAVQHAHRQLVVHRDLKPGNILVTEEGDVKLLDFGIAKLVAGDEAEDDAPLTRTGMRMMTPEYASPEQVSGGDITTSSDIYALGILLYELVTGQRPFAFETHSLAEIERIVMEQRPRRPSTAITREEGETRQVSSVGRLRSTEPHRLMRQIQGDLDTIILMALNKEPGRRYPTAAALKDDLERYLKGLPVVAKTDSAGYRTRKFIGRHRVGVSTAVTLLLGLWGLVGFYTWRLTIERDRAQAESGKAAQVIAFMQDMLGSPRPEQEGAEVTVVQVMEEMTASLGTEFASQPQVEAVLRATVGYTYQGLGRYEKSQAQIERALAILEGDPDTPPQRLAQAIADVARLQHDRALYDSARTNYRRALDLYRARAAEDEGLEDVLNDFATLLSEQGDISESLELYGESLERSRARYGDDDPEVAKVLTNLASANLEMDLRELAEDQLREAIRIYSLNQGNVFELTIALHNLAYARLRAGDLIAADSMFRRSLALRREVHGDRHSQVAVALHALASQVLFHRGEYDEAARTLLEALDIYREAYPDGHLFPSVSMISLGKVRLAQGRLAEAEATLWQALGMQERLLPEDHAFTSQTRTILGEALLRQGRYAEAEPLLIRGLAGLESAERSDMTKEIDAARSSLAELYEALGKPGIAADYR